MPVDDFVDAFIEKLTALAPLDYLAKMQSDYFEWAQNNLKTTEVLVVADFSGNYSFIVQDSVQGMHWNNDQATVHSFACFAKPCPNKSVEKLTLW